MAARRSTTSSAPFPAPSKKALQGVENCMAEGLKVGLRFIHQQAQSGRSAQGLRDCSRT
jgi:hypothetical protein